MLKPGSHALVFAGTRTQDLMTVSLRMAGFEIRDVIEWLYFSGFPKSLDVSKVFDKRAGAERKKGRLLYVNGKTAGGERIRQLAGGAEHYETFPATDLAKKWDGWGTALKPAHEPIIVARKPLIGTVAENVEKYGTGALNIDRCRISLNGEKPPPGSGKPAKTFDRNAIMPGRSGGNGGNVTPEEGRFPANCVTTEPDAFFSKYFNITPPELSKKALKKDRNSDWCGEEISATNRHPTVKPTDLMAWLVRLITPPGGIVLDPFVGSGSTCVAARREGFFFIGIEQELEYVEIARKRSRVDLERDD